LNNKLINLNHIVKIWKIMIILSDLLSLLCVFNLCVESTLTMIKLGIFHLRINEKIINLTTYYVLYKILHFNVNICILHYAEGIQNVYTDANALLSGIL